MTFASCDNGDKRLQSRSLPVGTLAGPDLEIRPEVARESSAGTVISAFLNNYRGRTL
jgi:hypothetical protein